MGGSGDNPWTVEPHTLNPKKIQTLLLSSRCSGFIDCSNSWRRNLRIFQLRKHPFWSRSSRNRSDNWQVLLPARWRSQLFNNCEQSARLAITVSTSKKLLNRKKRPVRGRCHHSRSRWNSKQSIFCEKSPLYLRRFSCLNNKQFSNHQLFQSTWFPFLHYQIINLVGVCRI